MSLAEDAKPTDLPTTFKAQCPLCTSDAKFLPVHFGIYKKFYCKNCNVFVIHNHEVETITSLPKSEKERILKASKACSNDMVLVIHVTQDTKEITHPCEPENNWS